MPGRRYPVWTYPAAPSPPPPRPSCLRRPRLRQPGWALRQCLPSFPCWRLIVQEDDESNGGSARAGHGGHAGSRGTYMHALRSHLHASCGVSAADGEHVNRSGNGELPIADNKIGMRGWAGRSKSQDAANRRHWRASPLVATPGPSQPRRTGTGTISWTFLPSIRDLAKPDLSGSARPWTGCGE